MARRTFRITELARQVLIYSFTQHPCELSLQSISRFLGLCNDDVADCLVELRSIGLVIPSETGLWAIPDDQYNIVRKVVRKVGIPDHASRKSLLVIFRNAMRCGCEDEAMTVTDKLLDQGDPLGFCLKGEVLSRKGLHEEALSMFAKAISGDPDEPESWFGAGLAGARLGNMPFASKCMGRAKAIDGRVFSKLIRQVQQQMEFCSGQHLAI